jgi:hypothetical protein
MPAVIVAPAFLTSPHDERRLRSDAWQNRLADALAAAIDQFFSQPDAAEAPGTPEISRTFTKAERADPRQGPHQPDPRPQTRRGQAPPLSAPSVPAR